MKNKALQVALASFVALIFSGTALIIYVQSIYLEPMIAEFGWSRAQYFLPLTIGGILGAITAPYFGHLADRFGVRRLLLPAIVIFGLAYCGLAFQGGSALIYMLLMTTLVIASGVNGVLLYAKAVSSWPARHPAMMLAIALAGTAAGGILIPPAVTVLIEATDWRTARLLTGLAVLVIALPTAWAFVHMSSPADGSRAGTPVGIGFTGRQAIRSRRFWLVALAIALTGLALNALLTSVFPLLRDRGFGAAAAASGLSAIAIAQFGARFGSALLLDRFDTPKAALPWFACAAIGMAVVSATTSYPAMIVGMVLIGAGLGAELELAAYFSRRYFGLRHYGQIYGYIIGLFTLGATSGPLLFGGLYDLTGAYTAGIIVNMILLGTSILLMLAAPPYTFAADGTDLSTNGASRP